jgi:hypothetical protein
VFVALVGIFFLSFGKWWFENEGFKEAVIKAYNSSCEGEGSMGICNIR